MPASPIRRCLLDLKGLKIGISTARRVDRRDAAVSCCARPGSIRKKDVTIVPVGDPTTALAALKNGADRRQHVGRADADRGGDRPQDRQACAEHRERPRARSCSAILPITACPSRAASTLKERPQVARGRSPPSSKRSSRIQDPNQPGRDREGGRRPICAASTPISCAATSQPYRGNFRPRGHARPRDPQHQPDAAGGQADRPARRLVAVVAQDLMPRELPLLSDH